jgi:hypothetical protein
MGIIYNLALVSGVCIGLFLVFWGLVGTSDQIHSGVGLDNKTTIQLIAVLGSGLIILFSSLFFLLSQLAS